MSVQDKIIYLVRLGVYLGAILYIIDKHILPGSKVKSGTKGLE